MKRTIGIASFLSMVLMGFPRIVQAVNYNWVFNPFTGKQDAVTSVSSSSVSSNLIMNQNTLQSGATFYVSSGTVNSQFNLGYVTGATQCLEANTAGEVVGTGSACGGSGSSPGGSTPNVQYNNSGVFGGTANLDVWTSSVTAPGSGGLGVTYGINVGSMTGAGLATCGDNGDALSWSSSTNQFGCQSISTTTFLQNTGVAYGSSNNQVTSDTTSLNWSEATKSLLVTAGGGEYAASGISISSTIYHSGMDTAGFVRVRNHFAYVDGYQAGTLTTFDVTNPTSPVFLSQFNSGSQGMEGMAIYGNYLYTVSLSQNTFYVFSLSNPAVPSEVAHITDGTKLKGAEFVSIYGNYAYVANLNSGSSNPGISVIDISNPLSPSIVATLTSADLTAPVYFQIRYPYLYVTNEDTSCRMTTVDISNPLSPSVSGNIVISNCTSNPIGVELYGKYAYVAGETDDSIFTIDISTPSNPVYVSSTSMTGLISPSTLLVLGNNLFASGPTADAIAELSLSNPAQPLLFQIYQNASQLASPDDLFSDGNYLYTSLHGGTNGGMSILNIGALDSTTGRIGSLISDNEEITHSLRANQIYSGSSLNSPIAGIGNLYTDTGTVNILSVGTISGAGLSSCSGSSNALTWNSGTDLFGCNTISGGSGGSSTVAVTTGTATGFSSLASSPTAVINFDQPQFSAQLEGGATAFVTLNSSSVTLQGNTNVGLLNSTQTWTGQNAWTTPSPSTFTYGVVMGSVTDNDLSASLPVHTDANKHLITASISLTSDVSGILPVANGGTGASSLAGANIAVLTATQTLSGGDTFASPNNSTFTYGVVAGTVTAQNISDSDVAFSKSGLLSGDSNFQWLYGNTVPELRLSGGQTTTQNQLIHFYNPHFSGIYYGGINFVNGPSDSQSNNAFFGYQSGKSVGTDQQGLVWDANGGGSPCMYLGIDGLHIGCNNKGLNGLDVSSGVVVGNDFDNSQLIAPTNGELVEGSVGLATSTVAGSNEQTILGGEAFVIPTSTSIWAAINSSNTLTSPTTWYFGDTSQSGNVWRVVGDSTTPTTGHCAQWSETGALIDAGNACQKPLSNVPLSSVGISWDGGGSALTSGTTYWLQVPAAGTITKMTLTANPSGTFSVIVSSSASFGFGNANSICASDCPSLVSGTSTTDSTLTGWTTAVAKDEFLYFVSTQAVTSTQAEISLDYTKTTP